MVGGGARLTVAGRGRRLPSAPSPPHQPGDGRGRARAAVLALCMLASATLAGCALPRWPAEGPLSSAYGFRWRGWLPGIHRGVDISVPVGTPVRSMAGGRVRFAGTMDGYGRVVWVEHGGEVMTVYAHLSEIRVGAGAPVRTREVVGLSGRSGGVEGPHLHFELWRWGRPVDPVPLLGGRPGG